MSDRNIYTQLTNLRTILMTLGTAALGGFCLYLAENWSFILQNPSYQSVIRELGGLLVASIAISLLWELAAKRAFLSELMAKARLAEDVRSAGLTKVVQDFYRDIDWPQMLRKVNKLDIFFAYGQTWRNTNSVELNALAERSDARVRVVLPDPNDDELMSELGRRFEKTSDDVRKLVKDAVDEFIKIFGNNTKAKADFSLWYLHEAPVFSFYRFDNMAILALYRHTKGRGKIPVFVVEQGGTIYEFIRSEFDEFIKQPGALATKVYPQEAHVR